MKILITGANGQLGTELQRQLAQGESVLGPIPPQLVGADVLPTDLDTLDITDPTAVEDWVGRFGPDLVLHCAALTNVDGCEDTPQLARKVNGEGAGNLAKACERVGAKLVQVSTDYVFSGSKGTPYTEGDLCDPQSVYGSSKRLGEELALAACSRTFVVRTAWLYGLKGNNFVLTIRKKGRELGSLRVVNDQFGSPTNAEDLSYHILKLAVTQQYGVYHCTGKGVCSWYEFACAILQKSGISCLVESCTSQQYPQRAKRPSYSALAHGMLEKTVGDRMRPWQTALEDYLRKLEE